MLYETLRFDQCIFKDLAGVFSCNSPSSAPTDSACTQTVSKIFTGIMDWNFPACTLKINRCYDSNHAQGYSDLRSDYCYESEVSSSAISNASFSFMKKMLFMKMLESNGPDIEPYG